MLINAIHHFEILTKSSKNVLQYFVNGLNFKLIAVNSTHERKQHVIKSKDANFIITSMRDSPEASEKESSVDDYDTIGHLERSDRRLLDKILHKNDSVFNIALQVKSIDNILSNCAKLNVQVIKQKSKVGDSNGFIHYAIINSHVDGVLHTLIEKDNYKQSLFLPKINLNEQKEKRKSSSLITTHFDHLTFATYRNTSNSLIQWYHDVFNMKRFYLTDNASEDFIVKTGRSGMKLQAINYWFCAESGVYLHNDENKSNDFKFIMAEPINEAPENQISVFLTENGGPGVQHIGLYTPNITNSVSKTKENNRDASFYVPPDTYYANEEKIKECEKSGHDIRELKRNHILIDVEGDDEKSNAGKYLLQVFTKPLFDKNTFFLEFIQRVNGALGFGAGNIRALWNAVQLTLVNKK